APVRDAGFLEADQYGERVRRVWPDGTITTVTGNGTPGFSGDGGPAVRAQVDYPRGMAMLPDGDMLIADQGNERVRRVWPDGRMSTLASTRMFGGPRGLALTPEGGVLIATVTGIQYIDAHLGMAAGRPCRRLLLAIMHSPRRVRADGPVMVSFDVSMPVRLEAMIRPFHREQRSY